MLLRALAFLRPQCARSMAIHRLTAEDFFFPSQEEAIAGALRVHRSTACPFFHQQGLYDGLATKFSERVITQSVVKSDVAAFLADKNQDWKLPALTISNMQENIMAALTACSSEHKERMAIARRAVGVVHSFS